ncbi:MlaD family protein [Nocardia sp. NPDC050175]|uniref:MlaD family protein n=1 Tax=Nocardia sp. NPDC050175 TaxID=3364317 RepID=UPI00379C1551
MTTAATMAVVLAGCSYNPAELPLPSRGGGYPITVEFASALNLPEGAKLSFDGARVGSVRRVELAGAVVAVRVDVDAGVVIPVGSRATITQDTVLGDPYVQIDRPTDATAGALAPNARITLDHTTAPAPLEDTLAVLANFLGTGSLQQLQTSMTTVGAALPQTPDDARKVATTVAIDLRSLAASTAEIDRLLANAAGVVQVANDRSADLTQSFAPETMKFWENQRILIGHIGILLPSVGSVYTGGFWLVPMIDALATTAEGVGETGAGVPSTAAALQRFLHTTVLPFARQPRVDVTSLVTGDGTEHLAEVENLLRMLGAIR